LDNSRGGGGRLSLIILVSEKPDLVSEKSGKSQGIFVIYGAGNPDGCTDWSEYALFTFRFIRLFMTKRWPVQILIRQHGCTGWSGSTLFDQAIKASIWRKGLNNSFGIQVILLNASSLYYSIPVAQMGGNFNTVVSFNFAGMNVHKNAGNDYFMQM
jgi:hypothetical protein